MRPHRPVLAVAACLATAALGPGPAQALLGPPDAAGLFGPAAQERVGGSPPDDVVAADLDGDGSTDLAAALDGRPRIAIRFGDGKGGLRPHVFVPLGYQSHQIVAGDLDGDADIDLVVPQHNHRLAVLTNDGRGTFAVHEIPSVEADPERVGVEEPRIALADVDRDGRPDLVAVSARIRVLRNTGAGLGRPVVVSPPVVGHQLGSLEAIGDLTGDGAPDLVVSVDRQGLVKIAHNDGTGGFGDVVTVDAGVTEPPAEVTYKDYCTGEPACGGEHYRGAFPVSSATVADLDHDGQADLVVAHSATAGVTVLRSDGRGGFAPPRRVAESVRDAAAVVVADLDADRIPDLVVTSPGRPALQVALGGLLGFSDAVTLPAVRGWAGDVVATDLDRDSDLDLVVADPPKYRYGVLRNRTRPADAG